MTRGARKAVGMWSLGELARASVKPRTRAGYESRLRTLRAAGCKPSYKGLLKMIQRKDGTKAVSLGNTRSAVTWYRQVHGLDPLTPAQLTHIRTCLRGRRRLMAPTREKGAIDFDHLQQLLEFMKSRPARWSDEDRRNIKIAWGTALRTSQMQKLRRRHFIRVGDEWALRIAEQHNPRAGDRDAPRMRTAVVHQKVQVTLELHLPSLQPNDLVSPHWNAERYNRLIKEAAEELGWDDKLAWKGVHQLRHGVAVDLAEHEGLDAARALTGHRRPAAPVGTVGRYAATNEARRSKMAKKAATRGARKK